MANNKEAIMEAAKRNSIKDQEADPEEIEDEDDDEPDFMTLHFLDDAGQDLAVIRLAMSEYLDPEATALFADLVSSDDGTAVFQQEAGITWSNPDEADTDYAWGDMTVQDLRDAGDAKFIKVADIDSIKAVNDMW